MSSQRNGQGTELPEVAAEQSFVDEEAEFEDEVTTTSTKKKKKFDWDKLFAYRTLKVVRIQDKKLGIVYWFLVTAVIFYIIFFAFGIEGKHQQQEWGTGTVIMRFKGKAFCLNRVYDAADLRYPEVEPYGAFIMTKMLTVKDQTVGNCVNFDAPCPCSKDEKCISDGTDEDTGFCEGSNWCPSLGFGNRLTPPAGTQVDIIEGLEHTVLEIQSGIAFPGIGNYFFVTGASHLASNPLRNVTLGALLGMATPPIKLKDVINTGALISLSFLWTCDVAFECEPQVVIKRLDNDGFVQKRSMSRTLAGVTTRDAMYMYGIRVLAESSGMGRRVSIVLIVLQIGSGMALLRTASIIADFLMLNVNTNTKRKEAYYKCKVSPTRDYSDLQDRINLIQEEKDRMEKANEPSPLKVGPKSRLLGGESADNPGARPVGAGASVALGLGPGGRGGVPSKALAV